MPQKVLIVGADPSAGLRLSHELSSAGHAPEAVAADGAVQRSLQNPADIIVLDTDGLGSEATRLSESLRATDPECPILVISSRSELTARLNAFRSGADDYLVKPFDSRELLARMQALVRRMSVRKLESVCGVEMGRVIVDFANGAAFRQGFPIALAAKELHLLRYLVAHRESVVSRDELLSKVWGYRSNDTRTVDMHVASLRKKLEADPQNPRHLITVRGRGYQYRP